MRPTLISMLSNTERSTLVTMIHLGSSSSSPETLSESRLASEAEFGLKLRLFVAITISSMSSKESKESWSILLAGRLDLKELPLMVTNWAKSLRDGQDKDLGNAWNKKLNWYKNKRTISQKFGFFFFSKYSCGSN